MKSQPQNTEFRNNPETFPDLYTMYIYALLVFYLRQKNKFFNILHCFCLPFMRMLSLKLEKPVFEYSSFISPFSVS